METDVENDVERANRARQRLSQDLGRINRKAHSMKAQVSTGLKYGIPILVGVALVGVVAGALIRPKAAPDGRLPRVLPRDTRPTLFSELLRTAALSSVSVLANRVTQRLTRPLIENGRA